MMEFLFLDKRDFAARLDEFCELFACCFSAPVSEEILAQRYLENPCDDLLVCVAVDNNKIVANYSAVPVNISIGERLFKGAESLNTMTHPAYEGRGLFVKLASALYEKMAQTGYAMIMGFPNYLSNGIFCAKLGWIDVAEIPTLELTLAEGNHGEDTSISMSWGNWSELKDTGSCAPIQVVKSQAYLQWRYRDNREKNYEIVHFSQGGWAILHEYGSELNITEFHHNGDAEQIRAALRGILDAAQQRGMKKVTTWAPMNTAEHMVLERLGFLNKAPIRYFGVRKLNYQGEVDVHDFRNWRIYMGDDNVY